MPITTRSRIYVRWSTDPKSFDPAYIMPVAVEYYGTPKQVHEYLMSLMNKIGNNVCVRIDLSDKSGQKVSREEVANVVHCVYDRSR